MKTTKTYSIEESIYRAFDSLTTEKNINKSSFIEDSIKKFLKDNDMDFIDKLYSLRADPSRVVTVISQDSAYYILDDGSKIQKILFMLIFKECDPINPNEFFNKSNPIFEKLVEDIKKIDASKIDTNIKINEEFKEFNVNNVSSIFDNMKKNSNIWGTYRTEFRKEQVDILNKINDKYKTGRYVIEMNDSYIKDVCFDIIDLMKLEFSNGEKEYDLQQLLINILAGYKNTWWSKSAEKAF
jgi:hypothetical protein